MMVTDPGRWLVERHGHIVYSASNDHVTLVLRTLRIGEETWRRTIEGYAARWTCSAPDVRLATLAEAYREASPHAALLPAGIVAPPCVVCRAASVRPAVARSSPPLIYGRCDGCGHGMLLSSPPAPAVYVDPKYYSRQGADGVGYARYEEERAYREEKGARLFCWAAERIGALPRRMLEVGSGFGFTRRAAERLGCATAGVDANPYAAEAAHRLYGMPTVVGTLAEGLRTGQVPRRQWDLVLYQFLLEHVADPAKELATAAEALTPGGRVLLLVPSMDAVEIAVFGASYRSFRADHLHVFSKRSLAAVLEQAGLAGEALTTECAIHLLAGFLSDEELQDVYARGEGPNLRVLARSAPP